MRVRETKKSVENAPSYQRDELAFIERMQRLDSLFGLERQHLRCRHQVPHFDSAVGVATVEELAIGANLLACLLVSASPSITKRGAHTKQVNPWKDHPTQPNPIPPPCDLTSMSFTGAEWPCRTTRGSVARRDAPLIATGKPESLATNRASESLKEKGGRLRL